MASKIDGDVYDVSENRRMYGPGGAYGLMYVGVSRLSSISFNVEAKILDRAGIDAARAFGTGCFKEHRTHDLRGLTDKELKVSTLAHDTLHLC